MRIEIPKMSNFVRLFQLWIIIIIIYEVDGHLEINHKLKKYRNENADSFAKIHYAPR